MKRIFIALASALLLARVANGQQCTGTITDFQQSDDHFQVSSQVTLNGCDPDPNAHQMIVVRFLSNTGGNECFNGAMSCASTDTFYTQCLL
jgi:hypothetical protein